MWRKRRVPVVLLTVAAFAACTRSPDGGSKATASGREATGPKEVKEVEPNDTPGAAMSIREPVRVTAELKADGPKPDEDFFRLEPQGAGKFARFEVSGIPGADVALEVLDRDGNHVAVYNSEGEGKGEKIPSLSLSAPWLVKVHAAKKGSGGAYTATVTFSDAIADFEVEPNNRAVDATVLPLGKPIKGLLADRADEDWYVLEVPAPGATAGAPAPAAATRPPEPRASATPAAPASSPPDAAGTEPGVAAPASVDAAGDAGTSVLPTAVVRLEVAGVPDVRLEVEVANQAQAVFYAARSREVGEGIQVRNLALRPGETRYFVTVKSAWMGAGKDAKRGYNASAPYTLTVTPEEAGTNAELEPNDEAAKATPIFGEGTKIGYFAPKGDVDYYAVKCERPSLLKIELSGVDRVDSILSLVKPSTESGDKDEILLRANDGGVKEGEILVDIECGPTHDAVIRVEAAPRQLEGKWVRDQENPDEPYKLTVAARPDTGTSEREPNNSPTTATPIELGKPVRGHIHPKKDVDYFQIDLSKSPVKVPLKATVTGILKVDVALALHRLEGDPAKPTLVQRSDKGKGEQPEIIRFTVEPGIYLVEVRDTRNLQSNFMDAYQLTVEVDQ